MANDRFIAQRISGENAWCVDADQLSERLQRSIADSKNLWSITKGTPENEFYRGWMEAMSEVLTWVEKLP